METLKKNVTRYISHILGLSIVHTKINDNKIESIFFNSRIVRVIVILTAYKMLHLHQIYFLYGNSQLNLYFIKKINEQ